jgi:hypothetical protein
MTARTAAAACLLLGLASFAESTGAAQAGLPRISDPAVLALEMAKALVAGDRERITALSATREEMELLLETHQPPSSREERQELKERVALTLAARGPDFDRFQAMKKEADVNPRAAVRFEIIELDKIYEKDGMKKIRHSHVRMFQATNGGKEQSFIIKVDDMFLFPRGWAFTSVWPAIGKEPATPNPGPR